MTTLFINQGNINIILLVYDTYSESEFIMTDEDIPKSAAIDMAISKAEAEYAADGQLYDARSVLSMLKTRHFE